MKTLAAESAKKNDPQSKGFSPSRGFEVNRGIDPLKSFNLGSKSSQVRSLDFVNTPQSSSMLGSPAQELRTLQLECVGQDDVCTDNLDQLISDAVYCKSSNVSSAQNKERCVMDVNSSPPTDHVLDEESLYEDIEECPSDSLNEWPTHLRSVKTNVRMIPLDKMTQGQLLTRQLLLRDLGGKVCDINSIDSWDPLASSLDTDVRNGLVKEIEAEEAFLPTPGQLTPPLKGKGQALWARDSMLFRAMNDMNAVMKGTE
jgi:hypothetical protein